QRLDAADWTQINGLFGEMETEGRRILRGADVPDADVHIRRTAEMHYTGQGHEVEVEVPPGALDDASLAVITASFEAAYRALPSPGRAPRARLRPRRRPRARRTSRRRGATWRHRSTTATRSRRTRSSPDPPSSRSASPPPWPARTRGSPWTPDSP